MAGPSMEPGWDTQGLRHKVTGAPFCLPQRRSAAGNPRGRRTVVPAARAAEVRRTPPRRRSSGGNAHTSRASSCKSWRPPSKGTATPT